MFAPRDGDVGFFAKAESWGNSGRSKASYQTDILIDIKCEILKIVSVILKDVRSLIMTAPM